MRILEISVLTLIEETRTKTLQASVPANTSYEIIEQRRQTEYRSTRLDVGA